MDRLRLIRGLRIAWTAFFGVLCVVLIGLWARSYKIHDTLMGNVLGDRMLLAISQPGCIAFFNYSQLKTVWRHLEQDANPQEVKLVDGLTGTSVEVYWGFALKRLSRGLVLATPYWFLVLLSTSLSAAPWMLPKQSFSLRTLLIATKLIAVVLGLVVAFSN